MYCTVQYSTVLCTVLCTAWYGSERIIDQSFNCKIDYWLFYDWLHGVRKVEIIRLFQGRIFLAKTFPFNTPLDLILAEDFGLNFFLANHQPILANHQPILANHQPILAKNQPILANHLSEPIFVTLEKRCKWRYGSFGSVFGVIWRSLNFVQHFVYNTLFFVLRYLFHFGWQCSLCGSETTIVVVLYEIGQENTV